jgi:hypothetical protein
MDDQDFIVFDEQDYLNKLYEQSNNDDSFASASVTSESAGFNQPDNQEVLEAAASASPEQENIAPNKDDNDRNFQDNTAPKNESQEKAAQAAVKNLEETAPKNILMPRKITGRQR